MQLHLSRIHFPVTTLGPGRRVGIWLQGCSIRCAGCVSADTWGLGRGATTVREVVERASAWLGEADGATVSGGEPFDQPEALAELLSAIRRRSAGDILVYSGYPIERLRLTLDRMDGLIDALISDPYDPGAGQALPLRGSDNQRLHLLTALGATRFACYDAPSLAGDHSLDIMFEEDGTVFLAGIPRAGDMERLRALMAESGHVAQTSESREPGSAVMGG